MTVDCEGDAEILLGQKKELLAELEVERHEVRRKLFASAEIDNLGEHGEGGEEVLDDTEKGIENYADITDTGNQNNLYGRCSKITFFSHLALAVFEKSLKNC